MTSSNSDRSQTRLFGTTALVTGASRGIGRGIARQLATAGADVIINYRSHPEEAQVVVDECQALGADAIAIAADMGIAEEVQGLVDQAYAWKGRLDTVVSNAAYSDRELFLEADMEGFRRTIDVTMWGPFYLLRSAAQKMVEHYQSSSAEDSPQPWRNLVVISSPHAQMAIPGAMAYNMAKAAIDQMARTAAVELSRDRIRVNIIHPGWIDTPGERKFFTEETLAREAAKLPMGRLGQMDEIGRGVVFLVDPENEYVNGSTLTIDGAIQLPWREMYRTEEKVDSENG